MASSKYGKYLIKEPKIVTLAHHDIKQVKGRTWPQRIYMSKEIVPGCPIFVEFGWVYSMPEPNPYLFQHSHSSDEVVVHIGNDPSNPADLGAEIEFQIEDEKVTIDKTSAIYLPGGVKHGPVTFKKVTKPHLQMAITIGGFYD